jgi:prolyl 4-hydroxylase
MPSPQYLALNARLAARDKAAPVAMLALAEAGDADALLKAAELRMRGMAGPVDLKAAYRLAGEAAAKGVVEAKRAQAYLTAAGIGTRADPARARAMLEELAKDDRFVAVQLAFLDHVKCSGRVKSAPRQLVRADPHIEVVQGLFSAEECRYIQLLANPWMEPAMIYAADGGGMRDPHRDSDNMVVTPLAEDLVIQAINRCIAEASSTQYGWGEPLHVLRYRPGQQYRPHHDAHAGVPAEKRRVATALLYLNDAYEGGETHFPEIGVTVRGAVGDLLIFHNLTADRLPDSRMTHAGLPIARGEKWLATRWIRGSDYFGRQGPAI